MSEELTENKRYFQKLRALNLVETLRSKGFHSAYAECAQDAVKVVLDLIPAAADVGIGGSVTIRQMGLLEILKNKGHVIHDHWKTHLTAAQEISTRRAHLACDVFLSSTNAITREGTLINTDYSGNRVAAMIFGPKRTIIVAGVNKIVPDIESGMKRIRNEVSQPTSRRRQVDRACTRLGYCVDCKHLDRACRVTTLIEMCPAASSDFHVIIVGEELGY